MSLNKTGTLGIENTRKNSVGKVAHCYAFNSVFQSLGAFKSDKAGADDKHP